MEKTEGGRRSSLGERLASPAGNLAVALVLAVALMLSPASWSARLRSEVARVFQPGQEVALRLRDEGRDAAVRLNQHFDAVARLEQARKERQRLEAENRRLAAQLAAAESRRQSARLVNAEEDVDDRLLKARGVKARVLGHTARGFLVENHLLDAGASRGLQAEALVLQSLPGLIDQGENAHLDVEQLVLSQGQVWGKVLEVGAQTSTVRRVTEPGYRDLVRLATPDPADGAPRWGPEGIVEGAGQPLARIRLIEVTAPVAVGDLVYTAAGKGLLPEPLLYGRIVRLERPVGAAHWEIWMAPAVAPEEPTTVVVLRAELNPLRAGK
jgi:cell shape-determining protein MreC